MADDIVWKLKRVGDHYEGTIMIPAGISPVKVSTRGPTKPEALARAATMAKAIANNPILQAALPPGAAPAIKAVQAIAASTNIDETLTRYAGDGAKRLAKVLGF